MVATWPPRGFGGASAGGGAASALDDEASIGYIRPMLFVPKKESRTMKRKCSKASQKVFIVGLYISGEPPNTVWHLNGVVLTEKEAKAACTKPVHFYAEIEMGRILPDEWVDLPTTYPVKPGRSTRTRAAS